MNIESWKRRIVVVTTDVDAEGLEHDPAGLELLNNQEVNIIPIGGAREFMDSFTVLGGVNLHPKMTLVLSPFDNDTYVLVEEARNLIAIEKASITARFCKLLGAKSIEVENIKIVDNEKEKELSIDANNKVVSGSLKGRFQEISSLKNQLSINAQFTGGKPSLDKAKKILKANRLDSDPLLRQLYEMVADSEDTENSLTQITQEFSLTQSLQSTMELVGSIKFPSGMVSGAVSSTSKEKIEIFISLKITF